MDNLIKKYAIQIALGNNGGQWATHYNENQKNHWRNLVRELIEDVTQQITNSPANSSA